MTYVASHNARKCDGDVVTGSDLPAKLDKRHVQILKDNGKPLTLEIIGNHE